MDERLKKAFDFAQDTTKQLISLATGIIALTITFSRDFLGGAPSGTRDLAVWAWLAYLLSVACGVWTLMAMTGTLEPKSTAISPSIRGFNVIVPSVLQVLSFLAGLVLTVVFAINAR